jgi:hypothetical protein
MPRKIIVDANLINVEQKNALAPMTFRVLPPKERASVRPGRLVKIGVEFTPVNDGSRTIAGERFWVRVTSRAKKFYTGIVDNDLLFTARHGIGSHDFVRFGAWNILEIGS